MPDGPLRDLKLENRIPSKPSMTVAIRYRAHRCTNDFHLIAKTTPNCPEKQISESGQAGFSQR
jgi:hypothetical protein